MQPLLMEALGGYAFDDRRDGEHSRARLSLARLGDGRGGGGQAECTPRATIWKADRLCLSSSPSCDSAPGTWERPFSGNEGDSSSSDGLFSFLLAPLPSLQPRLSS